MQKIGFMGGTFNPVHLGHKHLACSLKQAAGLDRVLIIPANSPPHKACGDLANRQDRLAMCRLAFADQPDFEVSDIEFQLGGKSYTVNTVAALKQRYPDAALFMMIGGDMLLSLDTWKDYQTILDSVTILAAAREETEFSVLEKNAQKLSGGRGGIFVFRLPIKPMNSTEIRARLAAGRDVSGLLDPRVLSYIRAGGLYGGNENDG